MGWYHFLEHLWTARQHLVLLHESHFTAPRWSHMGLFLSSEHLCLLKPDSLLKDLLHTCHRTLEGSWLGSNCERTSCFAVVAPKHQPGHHGTLCARHFLNWLLCGTNPTLTHQLALGPCECDSATFFKVLQLGKFLAATQKEPFWGCGSLACVPHGQATLTSF